MYPLKYFLLTCIFLFSISAKAQNIFLPEGEFMDTTIITDPSCHNYFPYYYSVGGKYPKNSTSLLKDVHTFLLKKNNIYVGSGYVTFRFAINCHGNLIRNVRVMQTDEQYKSYHFSKTFVNELYDFLLTMDKWKVASSHKGEPINYMAYISFKIKNGKAIQIIP